MPDLFPHFEENCPCSPKVESYGDSQLIIHRSWDGQELLEPDNDGSDGSPKITIYPLGDGYQAQAGDDLRHAFVGFGNSHAEALEDLLTNQRTYNTSERIEWTPDLLQ